MPADHFVIPSTGSREWKQLYTGSREWKQLYTGSREWKQYHNPNGYDKIREINKSHNILGFHGQYRCPQQRVWEEESVVSVFSCEVCVNKNVHI